MKITSLWLIFFTTTCFATITYSQETQLTLDIKNETVREVFRHIEKNSEFIFFYLDKTVDLNRRVQLQVKDQSIEKVLELLFKDTDNTFSISDRQITIEKKNSSEKKESLQQKGKVKGTIVDETNEPVIGANIVIKGTRTGVISNINGEFELEAPDHAVLEITYIGFRSQEVAINGKTFLQIILQEEIQSLEELVIIGYGSQKKVNLTGSVSSVSARELAERPQPNVQNMLQGKVPGLQIVSPTGQPGRDHGDVTIRGKGSFGASSAPLILVDGMIGELNMLSGDDIESVSVLKDAASSAIYGARAANGVILITTKRGKSGKAQVSYNMNWGLQKATRLGDQIWESATYMELYNQMADRMGGRTKYSDEMISRYKDPNRNKMLYPDYNWMEETFKSGHYMTHNIGINGGTDKTTYNISLGYMDQDGILDRHDYKRYTGLMSVETQVHDRIKVGGSINLYYGKTHEPYYTNQNLTLMIASSRPMTMPYLPDGSGRYSYESMPESYGGEWQNRNPVWVMNETSRSIENWMGSGQAWFDVDFIKKRDMKLTWSGKGGFKYNDQFQKIHYPAYPEGYYYLKESDYMEGGRNEHILATDFFPEKGVENKTQRLMYTMLYTTLNYNWKIKRDHDLNALLGFQEEGQGIRKLEGKRETYPSDSMTEIDGGSSVGQTLTGNIKEFALRSLFGRVGYGYKDKYLAEANFRYDGTSRIHRDNRWGFFPSFSGAWRISEESFVKDNLFWLDNLKLRISWGVLGNSEIGEYAYQEVYTTSGYIFNGEEQQGVVQNALKDRSLKWEKTKATNIGLDLTLWQGLFSLTFDWYNKVTDGILSAATIPSSVGMTAPTINYGKLQNRGMEFEIGHQNRIGDFTYGAGFLASLNKNKVLELRAPSYGSYINEVGKPYGEHYLYIWDGIFQSEEDIATSPAHPNNPQPGDIKFKDLNNDGVIDSNDRQMVEGVYPKMLYSFNLNFGYKNFDISAFFQGITGRKIWTNFFGEDPFSQGSSPNKKFLNAWTPENPNTDVPAIYAWGYAPIANTRSTYHLKDASYLRLKNLQIGYNVPKKLIQKAKIDFLRVYFSGENLLTFTPYPDYDPERGGDGWHTQYPQTKTFSFGLNIKF